MRNFFRQYIIEQNRSIFTGYRNRLILLLIIIVFSLLPGKTIYSQSAIEDKINFSVENEKISVMLIKLSSETGINFSYDSDGELFDKRISYTAEDKSPLIIIEEILNDSEYNYKLVGNQVVIFKDNSKTTPPVETQNPVIIPPEPVVITQYIDRNIYDTVFLTDTLVKIETDTIVELVRDTITVIDTVFLEKEKHRKQPNKIKDFPVDHFKKQDSRESGWSGSVYAGPILTDFSLVRDDNTFTVRSYSLGVGVSKLQGRWNFNGGAQLVHFGEKFDHSYTITDGGYYVTDTIDVYYTIVQNDTSYYYVTDSTWKPQSSEDFNYVINNRIGLLEFALSVSYDFYTTSNSRFYARLGAQLGFVIYSNGIALPYDEQPEGVDFADLKFAAQSFSATGGIGMKYRINSNFDVNPELYYSRYFNNLVDDYPKSTRVTGFGLKIGLIYYF